MIFGIVSVILSFADLIKSVDSLGSWLFHLLT